MDIQEFPRPDSICSGLYKTESDEHLIDDVVQKPTLWEEITKEFEDERLRYFQSTADKDNHCQPPNVVSAVDYLEKEIYPTLLPAIADSLQKAIEFNCLLKPNSRFNGIDNIAEFLWNKNKKHSRGDPWMEIFKIPFAIKSLCENPRPIFPPSMLLTDDEAARIIQKAVRGFLARRRDDVQEVRQYWKILKEDSRPELEERAKTESNISQIGQEILDTVVGEISDDGNREDLEDGQDLKKDEGKGNLETGKED